MPLGVWVVVVGVDYVVALTRFHFKFLVGVRISRLQKFVKVKVIFTGLPFNFFFL